MGLIINKPKSTKTNWKLLKLLTKHANYLQVQSTWLNLNFDGFSNFLTYPSRNRMSKTAYLLFYNLNLFNF